MGFSNNGTKIIVALGVPLIGLLGSFLKSCVEDWKRDKATENAKQVEADSDARLLWQFKSFESGAAAANWISNNCVADPSHIYATLLNGDTFWVWCLPATQASQRAIFDYSSVAITPSVGVVPAPPFDRLRDVPISMGGRNNGTFLLFKRN